MSNEIEQKVREMAKLAILSNRLSEFHILNLKTYPKIFFDSVKQVELKYDFSQPVPGTDNPFPAGLVSYKIIVPLVPEDAEKRCGHLTRAVQTLFWRETHVTVEVEEAK